MSKIGHISRENLPRSGQIIRRGIRYVLATSLLTFAGTTAAFASDGNSDSNAMSKVEAPTTDGLNINLTPSQTTMNFDSSNVIGLSPSLGNSIIDLPGESVGSRLFNLDISNISCVTGEEGCVRRTDQLDLGYSKSLTTKLDGKLDIQLTPRASVSFNDDSSSAVVGALVRIGDDLREDSDLKSNTWYMFAGADAEAVTYAPGSISRIASGDFHLQDRVIVGDAQAGVGYRLGDADVSLGYFRREVTSFGRELNSGSISFKEDAAALSFTWRR